MYFVLLVCAACVPQFVFSNGNQDEYKQPSSLQSYQATQPLYNTGSANQPPMAASERYGFVYTNANDPTKKPQDRHLKWFKVFSKKKKKKEKFGKIFKKCQIPVGITVVKKQPPKYHYHEEEEEEDDDHYAYMHMPQHYGYWRRQFPYPAKNRNYQVREDQTRPNHPGYTPNHPGYTPNHPGYTPNHPGYTPNHPGYMYQNRPNMYPFVPPFRPLRGPIPYYGQYKMLPRRPWSYPTPWKLARPGSYTQKYVLREPIPGAFSHNPPQPPLYKASQQNNKTSLLRAEPFSNPKPYQNDQKQHPGYVNPYSQLSGTNMVAPQLVNVIFQDVSSTDKDNKWRGYPIHVTGDESNQNSQNEISNLKTSHQFNQPDFSKFGTYDLFPNVDNQFSSKNIQEMTNFESKRILGSNNIISPKHSGVLVSNPSVEATAKDGKPKDVKRNDDSQTPEAIVTVTPTPIWANSNYFQGLEQNVVENIGLYTTTFSRDKHKVRREHTTQNSNIGSNRGDIPTYTKDDANHLQFPKSEKPKKS